MGSSSPSGETRYEWSGAMQPRWDRALNYLDRSVFPGGIDNASTDLGTYKPYTGQRNASLDYNQRAGIANMQGMGALAPSPFDYTDTTGRQHRGSFNAADDQLQNTLSGAYMGGNPGTQGGMDVNNPWTHNFRNEQAAMQNQFGGGDANPHFRKMLNQGMEDITGNYQKGTSADTTRMFNLAGAFGGSAHQNAVQNNEAALAKQLGNYASGMQNQQYDRSAGLDESRIGRMTSAQEGLLSRGNEGWQRGQDRASNAYEAERGRQMSGIGLGQNTQGLAMDRIRGLMDTGGVARGVDQQNRDFDYSQFTEAQNHPYKLLQLLMGNYAQAQGQTGQQNTSMYGGSNAGAIGGGLLALLSQM